MNKIFQTPNFRLIWKHRPNQFGADVIEAIGLPEHATDNQSIIPLKFRWFRKNPATKQRYQITAVTSK